MIPEDQEILIRKRYADDRRNSRCFVHLRYDTGQWVTLYDFYYTKEHTYCQFIDPEVIATQEVPVMFVCQARERYPELTGNVVEILMSDFCMPNVPLETRTAIRESHRDGPMKEGNPNWDWAAFKQIKEG